jgi:hypothetical protein
MGQSIRTLTALSASCGEADSDCVCVHARCPGGRCLALMLLLVGVAGLAHGQTLVVTSAGRTVNQGDTLSINTIPNMPALTLSVSGGSSCDTVSYAVDVSYVAQSGLSTGAQYAAQGYLADQSVAINWFGILEGGNATITWQFNGVNQQSFGFFINGNNPSAVAIDAYASSGPWFIRNLISAESSYRQYDVFGYPTFGPPRGIGLMQLDPPPRDADYWAWSSNVADGLFLLNGKQAAAYASWNSEFSQMQTTTGGNPVYPPPTFYTYCAFQYPQPGGDSYADGDWIHYYNGNYFIFFHPADTFGPNRWDIDTNGYVQRVCNSAPQ